jgi:hypothetical protein
MATVASSRLHPCIESRPLQLRGPTPRDPRPLAHLWDSLPATLATLAAAIVPPAVFFFCEREFYGVDKVGIGLTLFFFAITWGIAAFFRRRLRATRRVLLRGTIVVGRIVEVSAGYEQRMPSTSHASVFQDMAETQIAVQLGLRYIDAGGTARVSTISYRTERLGEIDKKDTDVPVFCDPDDPDRFAVFLPSNGMVFGRSGVIT